MARFLVVDDDSSAVKAMTQLLADDGHAVAPFTAGSEAVKALASESFDAVVTDLEMPNVDGPAVVRATRARLPTACLVVVTGQAREYEKTLAEAGTCIVADKPLDYAEVTKAIAECRARGGPGAHGRCHMRSRHHDPTLAPLRHR